MITQIVFSVLFTLLHLFTWALILYAIISTLMSFGILDSRNRFVWSVSDFLFRVTDPALRPIRAVLPSFGGIDLSFLVALLLIQLVVTPVLVELETGLRFGVWQPLF